MGSSSLTITMLSKTLCLLAVIAACHAASMKENRQGQPVAESRDGAHHGGGGHAAPAPASSYDTGSQGNLYYYYYPVQEYGSSEASGGDFDIFTAIILPLLILGGLLLLLSSLTFTLTTGRAMSDEKQEPQLMEQLQAELERAFYTYLQALESKECIEMTICEMGVYSKDLKGSKVVLGLLEPMVPEGMVSNLKVFKDAAFSGKETSKCGKKYKCQRPKLM